MCNRGFFRKEKGVCCTPQSLFEIAILCRIVEGVGGDEAGDAGYATGGDIEATAQRDGSLLHPVVPRAVIRVEDALHLALAPA